MPGRLTLSFAIYMYMHLVAILMYACCFTRVHCLYVFIFVFLLNPYVVVVSYHASNLMMLYITRCMAKPSVSSTGILLSNLGHAGILRHRVPEVFLIVNFWNSMPEDIVSAPLLLLSIYIKYILLYILALVLFTCVLLRIDSLQ